MDEPICVSVIFKNTNYITECLKRLTENPEFLGLIVEIVGLDNFKEHVINFVRERWFQKFDIKL